jgi:hypothetical protein
LNKQIFCCFFYYLSRSGKEQSEGGFRVMTGTPFGSFLAAIGENQQKAPPKSQTKTANGIKSTPLLSTASTK